MASTATDFVARGWGASDSASSSENSTESSISALSKKRLILLACDLSSDDVSSVQWAVRAFRGQDVEFELLHIVCMPQDTCVQGQEAPSGMSWLAYVECNQEEMMAVAGGSMERHLRPVFEGADIDYGAIKMTLIARRHDSSKSLGCIICQHIKDSSADVTLASRHGKSILTTLDGTIQYLAEHGTNLLVLLP